MKKKRICETKELVGLRVLAPPPPPELSGLPPPRGGSVCVGGGGAHWARIGGQAEIHERESALNSRFSKIFKMFQGKKKKYFRKKKFQNFFFFFLGHELTFLMGAPNFAWLMAACKNN